MRRRDFLRRLTSGVMGGTALVLLSPFEQVAGLVGGKMPPPMRQTVQAMGTWINLTTLCEGDDVPNGPAQNAAIKEIERVERLMSIYQSGSDLYRVNQKSGGLVPVNLHTLTVAKAARTYADLTDGALDPTILPLMRYWGMMAQRNHVPCRRDLGACLEQVGYANMVIEDQALGLRCSGAEIDFGGIAKGYGVDCAIATLKNEGVQHGLVEAGGDLYAFGRPATDRRWQIGVRDPRYPERIFATLELENEAVATSGGYEKFRKFVDKKVSHLIDPRTGQPAQEIISATQKLPLNF
jgi:FAD:protein FMN transferase